LGFLGFDSSPAENPNLVVCERCGWGEVAVIPEGIRSGMVLCG
jgi:hypothetical protein